MLNTIAALYLNSKGVYKTKFDQKIIFKYLQR